MKCIIAGSRTINDYVFVCNMIKESNYNITEVICGAAIGIDSLGARWADENNKICRKMPANWKKYGKAAGPIRNDEMGKIADCAIIIWDGKSKGAKNMIEVMKKYNKPFQVFYYNIF